MLLLHELLKDWPCTFTGDTFKLPVKGITEHSKRVKPGYLFVARKGGREDGMAYLAEAVRLGAVAVVVDRIKSVAVDIPMIVVPNSQRFLSYASARLAGNPSEHLKVIAITGTNGKTTVAHFIDQLLTSVGVKVAVFGTLGVTINGVKSRHELPKMTTLPAEYLHPLLADCVAAGVTHVVMEASSLGLSTERLTDCMIDLGLVLNIGEDHYDEHGSEMAYLQAKQRLVQMAQETIINWDDEKCQQLARSAAVIPVYFGEGAQANYRLVRTAKRTVLKTPTSQSELPFLEMDNFNQLNLLAAIAAVEGLSYRYEKIASTARRLTLPEGRMERIEGGGVTVVIDYAHTPDALETVLRSIVRWKSRNVIVVFGCGGNRDQGKRPRMGAVAAKYASTVVVTSDNPRDEDPVKIIEDIVAGIQKTTSYIKEVSRQRAIQRAISMAEVGDVVLIAGKGHEKTQQIASKVYPFSDIGTARQQLWKKQEGTN